MKERGAALRLAAVVFTDIVSYSAVVHRDPVLGARLLDRQRDVVRKLLPKLGGREIETAGDSFLLEFDSALVALQCIAAIQRDLRAANETFPSAERVVLRASLHVGDVAHRGREIFGDGVNVSARVLPFSPEGGAALSDVAHRQVQGYLRVAASSIGVQPLKNIAQPVEIFTLSPEALDAVRAESIQGLAPVRGRRMRMMAAAAAVVLAVSSGIVWRAHHGGTAADSKSVAVMPLRNEGDDASNEYFSDGLTEDLISALAQLHELKVIGRESSFQFKGTHDAPAAVGEKLGVGNLLEGTVRRQGNRVRIVAELVRVADGSEIWSQTFDRELRDVFAVQSEIAQSVAGALQVALGATPPAGESAPPGGDMAAYDALLRGRLIETHASSMDEMMKALGYYEEAVRIDPKYAVAYAAIADAWVRTGFWTAGAAYIASCDRARAAARQALQLDPQLAAAHAALGQVLMFDQEDLAAAKHELGAAYASAPNAPDVAAAYSFVQFALGDTDEALSLAQKATQLDPLSLQVGFWVQYELGLLGRDAEAVVVARRIGFTGWASMYEARLGRFDAALADARSDPNERSRPYYLAYVHTRRGNRQAADAALAQVVSDKTAWEPLTFQVAQLYAVRGEKEKAFEWLERARAGHDGGLLGMTREPDLASLRADPRFAALARQIGLPLTASK